MRLLPISILKNCKYKSVYLNVKRWRMASETDFSETKDLLIRTTADPSLIDIADTWTKDLEPGLRELVQQDMQVIPNFITEEEEALMLSELEPQLKRMRYEYDHWDNAIQGFRETERTQWTNMSKSVLSRIKSVAFPPDSDAGEPLPHAHVLDLSPTGYIKPHVDAVRFCGDVIAGLCLLSPAVMHLQHIENKELALYALLSRRGLYIMKGVARYDFTHAVLDAKQSSYRGERVVRRRRVAVICRSRPPPPRDPAPAAPPAPADDQPDDRAPDDHPLAGRPPAL